MNRNNVVERAMNIAATQRDMSMCAEEHSLYASVCRVLDELRVVYIPSGSACIYESSYSPFSSEQLRKAIADALRLARKELQDDTRSNRT